MHLDKYTNVNYYYNTRKSQMAMIKRTNMNANYMMNVHDVMRELGVSKSKAYEILRQLNKELERDGYKTLAGKVPRPYWEKKFYGYTQMAM